MTQNHLDLFEKYSPEEHKKKIEKLYDRIHRRRGTPAKAS